MELFLNFPSIEMVFAGLGAKGKPGRRSAEPSRYLKLGEGNMPMEKPGWRLPHIKGQGVNHGHGVHCRTTSLSALFNSKFSMEISVQPLTF